MMHFLDKVSDRERRLEKVLGDTQIGTVLEQESVDAVVAQIVDFRNAFRQNMPRRPGSGRAHIVTRRTPGTTAAEWVADTTETFNQSDPSYTEVSFQYKTLLSRGRISRRAIATGRSLLDVWMEEIESRSNDFRDEEDDALLTNATSSTEFDGLQILVTNTVGMTTAAGGDPLTLIKVDEAIDANNGDIDMMIMATRTRRELFKLLLAAIETTEVAGGFKLPSYAGIPIFVSTNIPITETFDGSTVTSNTGSNTSEILFLNTRECFIGELTPITMKEVNPVSSQVRTFEIYEDIAPVIRNTLSCSRLIGISPAV